MSGILAWKLHRVHTFFLGNVVFSKKNQSIRNMSIKNFPIFRTGIGQDSHRFLPVDSLKPCMIGGIIFEGVPGLDADSDGDVVYHALCNAISSLTGVPILSQIAMELCRKDGITDSEVYVEKALETLERQKIVHIAFTIEGKRPRLQDGIDQMKKKIASVCKIEEKQVGLTVTSGDGLTDFGCGEGVQCICVLTTTELVDID
jgi:2-C-methyl-D-erythritol 2,4-cyclodiphosphate synthase